MEEDNLRRKMYAVYLHDAEVGLKPRKKIPNLVVWFSCATLAYILFSLWRDLGL